MKKALLQTLSSKGKKTSQGGYSPRANRWDAFFVSLMVGVGECYFAAFALAKNLGEVQSGLITTVPLVLGAVAPLLFSFLGPQYTSNLKLIKKWVIWSVGFQILSLFGFFVAAALDQPPLSLVYCLATLYFAASFTAAPSWNYWMGALVHQEEVSHFFADRLRFTQGGQFLGLLIGGQILHLRSAQGAGALVFSILFALALLARLASLKALLAQPETSATPLVRSLSLQEAVRGVLSYHGTRKFFSFLFLFYIMIYISSPFVNPFFLAELEMSYQQYMFALSALMIGKALILPWGVKVVKRYGVKTVFWIGALGISPLPAIWAISRDYKVAIALQMTSGIFWALFELGFSVIFFSHLKAKEKIPLLSVYNFLNSLAILLGSLLGAMFLAQSVDHSRGYELIFLVGSSLRILMVLSFFWLTRHERTFFREDEPLV